MAKSRGVWTFHNSSFLRNFSIKVNANACEETVITINMRVKTNVVGRKDRCSPACMSAPCAQPLARLRI